MRASLLSAAGILSLLPSYVSAFSDTSPYIVSHPSAAISLSTPHTSAVSTSDLLPALNSLTSRCDVDTYLLILLPALHASSLHHYPILASHLPSSASQLTIPYVFPTESLDVRDVLQSVATTAKEQCGAIVDTMKLAEGSKGEKFDGVTPRVVRVEMVDGNSKEWGMMDRLIGSVMEGLPTKRNLILVASTPVKRGHDEVQGVTGGKPKTNTKAQGQVKNVVIEELKKREDAPDGNPAEKGSLFERYQFFTPGLFMGYIVLVILLGIGYVGVSALAGLKVSYGAFEKDAVNQGEKKRQ